MVRVIEKFLLVLGLERVEVVRHFIYWVGENTIVLFDPRIGLDDQDIKLCGLKLIEFNYLMEIQGKP